MSASREKKARQEILSQEGYVDPKAERLAKEAAENRRSKVLYSCIAVVFVIVAALLIVMKTGILTRSATAVTVDGVKYTPGQVDYYYYNALNNIRNSSYYSYMGIDDSTPIASQSLSEMAKMLLGVDSEEELTWHDYLLSTAKDNLSTTVTLANAAKAEGMTLSDENKQELEDTMASLKEYASSNGYSSAAYLKLIFGENMTMNIFKDSVTTSMLALQYQQQYVDSLTFTDEELESAYAEERLEFDVADYETLYFNGTAPSTTDESGNTVAATEEAQAAAAEAAKTAYDEALARLESGEVLEHIAPDYEDIANYNHVESGAYTGTDVTKWVFEESHEDGDHTGIESGASWYLVVFHSCGRPEYNTVNVRHILTLTGDDADAAKATAEANLAEWKAGEATAESFAAMAEERSEDTGSAANGGLISGVAQDNTYVQSFQDWCFEDGRAVGDTGIVESSYGYHVMYLDSFGEPYWKQAVTADLQNHRYTEWIELLTADVVVADGTGIKYVGA